MAEGNVKRYNYMDVSGRLALEVACIQFFKKNGDLRFMLATRDLGTIGLLEDERHYISLQKVEARSSIKNGNIAVFDLEIEDGRTFNINRIVGLEYLGSVSSMQELIEARALFTEKKNTFMQSLERLDGMMDYLGD